MSSPIRLVSWKLWAYPVLVGLPVVGTIVVLVIGRGLQAPPADPATAVLGSTVPAINATLRLPVFLAQIVIVIAVSRALGRLLRSVGQPQVVGEMLAGLVLGPSLLGLLAPELYAALFPAGTVRFLVAVSQVGLLLFMFLIGLELDTGALRERGHAAVLTSHASIATPIFLGTVLALVLYPRLSSQSVPFVTFALFLGTALSVTAFPVLARILTDRGMDRTPLGGLAIVCAAVDDVTAWCLLAALTALARPGTEWGSLALTLGALAAYVVIMFSVVKKLLSWIVARSLRTGQLGQDGLATIIVVALSSAWATDLIGVHALFGAFMAGVVMPRDAALIHAIRARSEDLLLVLLLPLFFVATGIRTNILLLSDSAALLALTIAVAVAGKLGGSTLAARASGLSWREGIALGSLLNARGLIGLVVVNVGLEAGVISPRLYAMLVIMALVTTFMASPMLSLLYPHGYGRGTSGALHAAPTVADSG